MVTPDRVAQTGGHHLADAAMAVALLGRMIHRGTILEWESKSYPFKEDASRTVVSTDSS